jgi:glycosyl transferase family 2
VSSLTFEAPAVAGGVAAPRETPTIAVAVAAYQAARTIAEALESVFAQTHAPREVIVCDDGSTDGTADIVRRFDAGIRVIRQSNQGEGAAKNAAARAARADFVAFLDADDLYLPRRLEALAELAVVRPDLDILTTDAVLEIDGRAVRRCYTDTWRFETSDQRSAILERNFVFGLAAVRRSRFLAVGGFDVSLRWATDWDCWIRMIVSGSRVGLVAEPLARYRLRPDSLSAQRSALLEGRAAVLDRAAGDPRLTPAERAAVESRAAASRRDAAVLRAIEAVAAQAPDARELALGVARTQGLPATTRLRAAAAAAAPRVCGRILRRRGLPGPAGVVFPQQ